MNKPHVHAELIKQWADGAIVEWRDPTHTSRMWHYISSNPSWSEFLEWRVKPHKWQKELDAQKEGKVIQYRWNGITSGCWSENLAPGEILEILDDDFEYRVKPEPIWYRNYLYSPDEGKSRVRVTSKTNTSEMYGFICWIGEWQEHNV